MDRVTNPWGRFAIQVILVLFAIYSVVPFLWTALQSVKTVRDAGSRTPLLVFSPTMENYQDLWLRSTPENPELTAFFILLAIVLLVGVLLFAQHLPGNRSVIGGLAILGFAALIWAIPQMMETDRFYDFFVNTLIVTVGTIVISISIGCMAGYALARYVGILGVILLLAALGFRALPRFAYVLPYYWMGSALNLLDTQILVIITLVAVNQPFTIWMLRSFFMEVPKDLEEAAQVDGANPLVTFVRVIVPVAWPGIISTALFTLLLAYNEFLLVRVLTQTNWTLPVAISRFTGGEDPRHLTLAAAASVSATIPIIVVILFFQKHLVKGLAAGAVKG